MDNSQSIIGKDLSNFIQNSEKKDPKTITDLILNKFITPNDHELYIKSFNEGVCYCCGVTTNIYLCVTCKSIMFCLTCEEKVLKKHHSKCSFLISEEKRNTSINEMITPLMLNKQIIMASFLSKTTDESSKKKLLVMFSNYYFKIWDKPIPSDEKSIALMTSMDGLSASLVKIASLTISPIYFYLFGDCRMNNVCFSCNKECTSKCSRCCILTCNSCKTDDTHRLLCRQLAKIIIKKMIIIT